MSGPQGGGEPPFEVLDFALAAVSGVAVRGEVELATAPQLTAALDERIRRTSGPFVIDLSTVDFLDSCGIHCLVRARALLGRPQPRPPCSRAPGRPSIEREHGRSGRYRRSDDGR